MAILANALNNNKIPKPTTVIDNPAGSVGSEGFLKLFMATLQNQTINSTTDIKDIMNYTASMTTVETNNENKKALQEVVKTLNNTAQYSSQYGLLPAINKIAITSLDTLKFDGKQSMHYSMYAKDKLKNATLKITDSSGKTIKDTILSKYENRYGKKGQDENGISLENNPSGILSFSWDGKVNNIPVEPGEYSSKIVYTGKKGEKEELKLGTYKIQSIKFKDGEPRLNLGQVDASIKDIIEII